MKMDFENFNYEECYSEVMEEIKKPNIMVCGASQIGKSSLINSIFELSEAEKAQVGTEGKSVTRGVKLYSSATLNLYDSEGYETGEESQEHYKKEILAYIDSQMEMFPDDMTQHIHEVWYCISAGNKRFLDLDREIIHKINAKKIPIMLILTKVDCATTDELADLKRTIQSEVPGIEMYTYSTELEKNQNISEEEKKKYVQKDEMIQWAMTHLEKSLQSGLMPAVKAGINHKRHYATSVVVPKYVGIAAAAVVGTSFIPVPFSDSVPLMGIQMKMAMEIFNVYGIEKIGKKLVVDLVGTQLISYFGKTLASQIWGILPFFGNISKAVVNVSTAATITATLGMAITYMLERYLKECVNADGSSNLTIMQFMTPERMKAAIAYVKKNDQEAGEDAAYKISDMIEAIVDKVKKGK